MSHNDESINSAIQKYLSSGGKINRIEFADKKTVDKAYRKGYHLSRQHDNEKSRKIVEKDRKEESNFIFSKSERMSLS
jgi:hypothetical protein